MAIIISKNGEGAEKVVQSDFDSEDSMQDYIHKNPEIIPVYEIDKDTRLFIATREFVNKSGRSDALGIDQNGNIYIIETKLAKNNGWRKVIAQVLDYGASLWKRFDDFDLFIEEANKGSNVDFGERLKDFFSINDEEVEIILRKVKINLNEGIIKFVIVMDEVENELRDIMHYINKNSQFEIYAVRLEYYKHDEYEIMIPKIFGVEVKKNMSGSVSRVTWTKEKLMEDIEDRLGVDADKVKEMYEYFEIRASNIKEGKGRVTGSFSPVLKKVASPFTFYTDGEMEIKFSSKAFKDEDNISKSAMEKIIQLFKSKLEEQTGLTFKKNLWEEQEVISGENFIKYYGEIKSIIMEVTELLLTSIKK